MTRSGSVNPPITRLFEGEVLSVGGYNLRVLQTPGHDLHHLCLYDAESELLVGGDQVLCGGYPPIIASKFGLNKLNSTQNNNTGGTVKRDNVAFLDALWHSCISFSPRTFSFGAHG